jgi:hypothetical protein
MGARIGTKSQGFCYKNKNQFTSQLLINILFEILSLLHKFPYHHKFYMLLLHKKNKNNIDNAIQTNQLNEFVSECTL